MSPVKSNLRFSFYLVAVLCLLIFLHYLGWLAIPEQIIAKTLSPIQHSFYLVGNRINSFYAGENQNDDDLDPKQLVEQRDKLLVENAKLKTTLAEFQAWDQQSNFINSRSLEAVPARIIGRSFQSDAQILIIDKGDVDGLKPDMPVIIDDGVIIAKVKEVEKYNSKILLLNDSQSSLAAKIDGSDVQGVVVGDRGLTVKLELIPKDKTILPGTMVITSGLEETIPAGLVVGTVERLQKEENSFFQTAIIRPLESYTNLLAVSVLISQKND
ncbi:MAG: rod shape-determining protein MreC [Candidatus Buchananbacteria bacterium]|nr:rod shape-determining protein MreC [Candidatus Buchananbacteria bacterium]